MENLGKVRIGYSACYNRYVLVTMKIDGYAFI